MSYSEQPAAFAEEQRTVRPPAYAADIRRRDRWAGRLLLGLALAAGLILRIRFALHDDGLYWPDEIYQSLEPAHRLVFGYGLRAWEFVLGARSWAFPGCIAFALKACALCGLSSPREYLTVLRLLLCLLSIASLYGSYRLARGLRALPLAGACDASLCWAWRLRKSPGSSQTASSL